MRGRALYQELARASLDNARALLLDAKAVHRRGNRGHACALGVLAVEEAAKAIIYKQAAEGVVRFVGHNPNNLSTYSEKDLLVHKFKHETVARLLLGAIEIAPFLDVLRSTRKQSFTREDVERLLLQAHTRQFLQRTELGRGGRATKDVQSMLRTLEQLNSLKNGGLYVGREGDRVVHPNQFVKAELERVRGLSNLIVRAADQLVATNYTREQRRNLIELIRVVASQVRRVQRLTRRQKVGATS